MPVEADRDLLAAVADGLAAGADPGRAPRMQAYMKSEMPYLGVAVPKVRALTKVAAHPLGVGRLLLAWSSVPDRWLRRAAIIAQVGSKSRTDVDLLTEIIDANASHRDFFVRKAIGWALRDYARTDPEWVRAFVEDRAATLSSLSCREATRHLP